MNYCPGCYVELQGQEQRHEVWKGVCIHPTARCKERAAKPLLLMIARGLRMDALVDSIQSATNITELHRLADEMAVQITRMTPDQIEGSFAKLDGWCQSFVGAPIPIPAIRQASRRRSPTDLHPPVAQA